MNKKLFAKADEESIDIVERALGDLRTLGATIVDPGPEGALFQSCVARYAPELYNAAFAAQRRDLFPADAAGAPTTDHIATLLEMALDPTRVPSDLSLRNARRVRRAGRRQVHDEQIPARARRRQHHEQRRSDQQGHLLPGSELPRPQAECARTPSASASSTRRCGCRAASPCSDRPAVHAGAATRRTGRADREHSAAHAERTARAERERPLAGRLVAAWDSRAFR